MSKFNKPAPRLTKNNSFNKFSNNAPPKIITPLQLEVEEVKTITLPEPVIIEIKPVKKEIKEEIKDEPVLLKNIQKKASARFKLAVDQLMLNLRKEKLDHWE